MKIVQFKDGRYGIRTGNWLFGYRYLDFKNPNLMWSGRRFGLYYDDCTVEDYKAAQRMFNIFTDKGTPV